MKARWMLAVAAMLLGLASFAYSQGVGSDVDKAADKTADATKDAAKDTAHETKKVAKKTAHATEKAADKTADATKDAAKDTAHGTKKVSRRLSRYGKSRRQNRRCDQGRSQRYRPRGEEDGARHQEGCDGRRPRRQKGRGENRRRSEIIFRPDGTSDPALLRRVSWQRVSASRRDA